VGRLAVVVSILFFLFQKKEKSDAFYNEGRKALKWASFLLDMQDEVI
jgi:hypothetical protein